MSGWHRRCWTLLGTAWAFFGCIWRGADAADSNSTTSTDILPALVMVQSPKEAKSTTLGLFALYAPVPANATEAMAWVPSLENEEGCKAYNKQHLHSDLPVIIVVRRGTCEFSKKTLLAQAAGAIGIVIVNTEDEPLIGMNVTSSAGDARIFVASVSRSFGDKLITGSRFHKKPMILSISVYKPVLWNISELIVMLMATGLVVAGAYFSTADMREGSPVAQSHEEVVELSYLEAGGMCFAGSCVLVVLFFLMKYLIYFIIFVFCMGGASCIVTFGSILLQYWVPSTKKRLVTLPLCGPMSQAEVVACIPAAAVVGLWLVLRNTPYGFIFQDMIGAGFLCMFQRTLRLPNIKVAALLLSCMFFFDIFWVFLSPYVFHKSVMVEVAKGGGTGQTVPLLLVVPTIGDVVPGQRMLGFGDVALPGLLVSYLLRYDKICKRQGANTGYFGVSVVSYFCGLCVTMVVLCTTASAQPALLYLVPATLGTALLRSCCRGEFEALWEGKPVRTKAAGEIERREDPDEAAE